MTRFVVGPEVALRLAQEKAEIADGHRLLAPTLFRSQLLSLLYGTVRRGAATQDDADRHLDYVHKLKMRLLGDRVLQRRAWKIAECLDRPDTYDAEYVALTQLQADAFVTLDKNLASAAEGLVRIAPFEALMEVEDV